MEVGIRELRNHLSKWVARAREGEEIVITDRGKPVARLVGTDHESNFDRLVREGVVTPAKSKKRHVLKPLPNPDGVRLSEFVLEDRGRR